MFTSLQVIREEANFFMFFEKFRASKRKLEIDTQNHLKKETFKSL